MNYRTYTETFENGHQYNLVLSCRSCHKDKTITVNAPDLFAYNHGAFVQDAFPYLPVEDREMIISNICGDCFFRFH